MADKYVGLQNHDERMFDVYVSFEDRTFRRQRLSVLVPKEASRREVVSAALDLAVYARLQFRVDNVYVRKDHIAKQLREVLRPRPNYRELLEQAAARLAQEDIVVEYPVVRERHNVVEQPAYRQYRQPEPTAEEVASKLLLKLDPDLHAKMQGMTAFYFTTPLRRYIWYPNTRAIISLEEDAPKYVCIHSQDNAVETNKYDWAITMRTYILADEAKWRKTANFHFEYALRGGPDAFQQTTATACLSSAGTNDDDV